MTLFLYLQLRNLVWATSKHDVYLLFDYSVLHWSALSGVDTEIMDVDGHIAPSEVGNTFFFEKNPIWNISTYIYAIALSYCRSTQEAY